MADVQTPREVIGSNLSAYRGMRGLSQPEVAERMRQLGQDWSASTVSRAESGDRGIEVGELLALALVLGFTPGEFIDPTGPAGDLDRGLDLGVHHLRDPKIAQGWARGELRIQFAPTNRGGDGAMSPTPWTDWWRALVAAGFPTKKWPREEGDR